jgi:hypothetical protein
MDELLQGFGTRLVRRHVPHDAAPLAPCSFVGIGRVGGAPNDRGEPVFPIRHFQPLHGGSISSLCAALKSAREHQNPQQRAATGHVKRALVGSAEPQVLAAPRDAPEGDDA